MTTQVDKPGDPSILAYICKTVPPYRRHFCHRLAEELPELRLATLNTHKDVTRDWHVEKDEAIGLINLPEDPPQASKGFIGRLMHAASDARQRSKQCSHIIDILRQEPTAAVVVTGYSDLGRLNIIRWCHKNSIPCFMWGDSNIHGERFVAGWKKSLKRRLIQWIDRRVSGFFGCGRFGREFWQYYGVADERIFISPYEPDYSLITDLSQDYIDEVAQEYQLRPDRKRLMFSGRLIEVKRPDLLVKSFLECAEERPDWDLLMLGDGPLKEELSGLIPAELRERVHWFPFVNDQAKVSALYRACDALVLPSDYEPWALVINEAAAAGMAIIATDVVGAAIELVVDGKNGRLVPPGKVEELKDAILEVTDPNHLKNMKAASAEVLADWRHKADPVEGYRQALRYAGVLDAKT